MQVNPKIMILKLKVRSKLLKLQKKSNVYYLREVDDKFDLDDDDDLMPVQKVENKEKTS